MKTIFVNGTFDILHPGHVQLLNYARSLGDSLLVAMLWKTYKLRG